MSEIKSIPVKVVIEDVTGENGGLIWELNLKEILGIMTLL